MIKWSKRSLPFRNWLLEAIDNIHLWYAETCITEEEYEDIMRRDVVCEKCKGIIYCSCHESTALVAKDKGEL